ncbi:MAG: MopE-related protein, partial [Myxococcota bacterium]
LACEAADGWTTDTSDCDDAAAGVNPGADEVCGGADDNCDGTIDEPDAVDAATWYDDADGDGYGNVGTGTTACDAPVGAVATATDCDDGAAGTYPGAAETCDDVDQDCDGAVDDRAVDAGTWYADADGDRFGNASVTTAACDAPSGYVADASDCDDASSAAYPGAAETCDDRDNDCDGSTDEAGAAGETTWYLDADGDEYGVSAGTAAACDQPAGYAPTPDDCDDADDTSNPGASERDDGADNDCDGLLDEDFVAPGDIIITEVHRQPRFGASSTNTNGQWFELYNTTGTDIDLSNWYIQRVSSAIAADGYYIDPADGVVVGAGDYVTLCKTDNFVSSSTSYSTMAPCDYYWGNETASASYASTYEDNTFNLQRDEDTLALYVAGNASTGTLVDAVTWTYDAADGYWPRDASRSMQLDPDAYDATSNDSLDNWCSTTNNGFFRWYNASVTAREYGTPASDNHSCP